MSERDDIDLSPYELRDSDHTDLFGIFMAVHALPGAVLLLHTTVGCKFKTQLHLAHHDWMRESHNQRLWTGVDDVRLIRGSGERLVEFATTWYERRKPELFLVATSTAVELSAFDVESAVETLRRTLPCPVILMKAPGYDGSLWRGYRRVVRAALGLVDWSRPPEPSSIAIAGYLMDRYEMDHAANLNELRRLFGLLGLKASTILFGGEEVSQVLGASAARAVIALPYAHDLVTSPVPLGGRPVVPTDLPIGLEGTSAFLRAAADGLGLDRALVDLVIRREQGRAAPRIALAAKQLRGARAALFLDTPTAAAVHAFASQMGVQVDLVCLTDGEEASEEAFWSASTRLGAAPARRPEILVGPSRDGAMRALFRLRDRARVQLVVGSSFQQAVLSREWATTVEIGYPSSTKHWIYPMPWMGYNGAVALAQRFLDAASENLAY